MAHKLILDGDYGIDDSLAALFLCHQPDVEILAVGSVHGNATADDAARNALGILALGGRTGIPVAVGAQRPMAQPVDISSMVHGEDGLGGRADLLPMTGRPVDVPAAVQITQAVRAHPGECTIVATGPLTNLALALLLDPDIAPLVAGVFVMGGTLDHPGNISPYAEANIAHDPEAAALVFAAGWPVTQVGLDVTMTTWMGPAELSRIQDSDTPSGRLAWSMLQHYLGFYAGRHERPGCPLHDPTATLVALDPNLASWFEAPVEVELRSGSTRGMLLVDRREFADHGRDGSPPAVRLVTELDGDRLIRRFLDGLLAA